MTLSTYNTMQIHSANFEPTTVPGLRPRGLKTYNYREFSEEIEQSNDPEHVFVLSPDVQKRLLRKIYDSDPAGGFAGAGSQGWAKWSVFTFLVTSYIFDPPLHETVTEAETKETSVWFRLWDEDDDRIWHYLGVQKYTYPRFGYSMADWGFAYGNVEKRNARVAVSAFKPDYPQYDTLVEMQALPGYRYTGGEGPSFAGEWDETGVAKMLAGDAPIANVPLITNPSLVVSASTYLGNASFHNVDALMALNTVEFADGRKAFGVGFTLPSVRNEFIPNPPTLSITPDTRDLVYLDDDDPDWREYGSEAEVYVSMRYEVRETTRGKYVGFPVPGLLKMKTSGGWTEIPDDAPGAFQLKAPGFPKPVWVTVFSRASTFGKELRVLASFGWATIFRMYK
jgi:hypothetical protein